ncbi:hypothetical protein Trydic_g677 [Trypoxylus dichotomus]
MELRDHQYSRRVLGSSATALHFARVDRSSVDFYSTQKRCEPLDLEGLDVASTRMATPTVPLSNSGKDNSFVLKLYIKSDYLVSGISNFNMADLEQFLREAFPNKSQEVIEYVIGIIEENSDAFSSQNEKLEAMINLLSGTAEIASTPAVSDLLDEAAGYADPISDTLKKLLEMIPDADPSYLENNAQELAYDKIKLI